MNKKELTVALEYSILKSLNFYSGALFHNELLENSSNDNHRITYEFDNPNFEKLLIKYDLVKMAGKGSEFDKMLNIMNKIAPKLTHSPDFDNSLPLDSISLLEYALDNKHGINCLCKSKIFTEIALALGIYARRMWMMPYSPYDSDNHVIFEIYDTKYHKWIALDPTQNAYYSDESLIPLNLLEVREKASSNQFWTMLSKSDKKKNLVELSKKYIYSYLNAYTTKNLFYFIVEKRQGFGNDHLDRARLYFYPDNFNIQKGQIANVNYRKTLTTNPELIKHYQKWHEEILATPKPISSGYQILNIPPIIKK